jgi:protein disulfide-isomerase
VLSLIAAAGMASTALAQASIGWQHDIEAAKAAARQSNRLVLVHVWGDGCAPCKALESGVFNQPGVAGAIESQFVPVKLNANEFPATAQGFGITRIPTDVILTPDGQVVGKMISPATPSAYVGELTQVANQYRSQSGQALQTAGTSAPKPPVLNPAYADLDIGVPKPAETPVATAPPSTSSNPYLTAQSSSAAYTPPPLPPAASAANPYPNVGDRYATPAPASVPTTAPPAQTTNPYLAYGATSAPPAASVPITPDYYPPPQPSVAAPVTGYDMESTPAAAPPDRSIPPANMGGVPVSEEAKRPAVSPPQPTTASVAPTANQPLPPGAPPLGFEGYCPVSMRTAWKWVPGDAKYGAIHRGRTYLFSGPQEQQQFLANPDFYGPALAGIDPVLAIDHKQSVPGLREHSLDYDNQFYLFSSEATLQQFTANPERYASGVRQAMGIQPGEQTR